MRNGGGPSSGVRHPKEKDSGREGEGKGIKKGSGVWLIGWLVGWLVGLVSRTDAWAGLDYV